MVKYVFPVGDYTETEDVNEKVMRLYNQYQPAIQKAGGFITWVKSWSKEPAMLLVELPENAEVAVLIPDRPFEQRDFLTNVF